jgi:uncharacterized protein (DUF983 family)
MNITDNIYQNNNNTMKPRFVRQCPVCGDMDCKKDLDYPKTMEECKSCGAEWNCDGELTLDPRDELTESQVLVKGWFVDVTK